MSRVCRDPTSTKNGMSMIHLSSHGTAPSQDRIKPRAYTLTILIISSYSHFFPDFQLFVATDSSNYCCFCCLLAVLSLLFSVWQGSYPQVLLLVLLYGHFKITERLTVVPHGQRCQKNMQWDKGRHQIIFSGR